MIPSISSWLSLRRAALLLLSLLLAGALVVGPGCKKEPAAEPPGGQEAVASQPGGTPCPVCGNYPCTCP